MTIVEEMREKYGVVKVEYSVVTPYTDGKYHIWQNAYFNDSSKSESIMYGSFDTIDQVNFAIEIIENWKHDGFGHLAGKISEMFSAGKSKDEIRAELTLTVLEQ